jgi:hypothetical protein
MIKVALGIMGAGFVVAGFIVFIGLVIEEFKKLIKFYKK